MSQGFVLDIPLDMLDRLDTANAKLTQLAAASERTMDRVKNSFNKMSTEGVAPFIQKLVEAKSTLSSLGTTTVTFTGINKISSDSVKAIDDVSRLAQSLNQLGQSMATSSTPTSQIGVESIRQTVELTKGMRKELSRGSKWFEKLIESAEAYAQAAGKLAPTLERAKQAQREFNEEAKKYARQNVLSLIDSSGSAKTLNELKNYARELKATMNNLDPKSQEWQKLNEIYKQTNREIKNINSEMNGVNKGHKNLLNTLDQLKRAFALAFSVSAIKGYVTQIARVRGEFELQQRSLQAILQNKDVADEVWRKTVALAVRSPFQVKELVTYTKQLAAYRVESDKLYDTTKMLADVSAGLGVDMQRLILAYGQVKAANYLRGTELRQFSEAGINILDELAKHFEELEGRTVSVGEVFERVSKRMVTFADVEEVFKRITKEGGLFYNMQEIQAETLKGQMSNLRDSIDIMLDSIGKENEDVLKSVVGLTRELVENWRAFAAVLEMVIFAISINSIHNFAKGMRLTGEALLEATTEGKGFLALGAKLKTTIQSLFALISAHPFGAALAAIGAVIFALAKYNKSVKEANKRYDELSATEIRRIKTLNDYSIKVEENNRLIKENANNEEELKKARGANEVILNRIKKEYPNIYQHIVKQKDGIIDMTKAIEEQNKQMQINIALQQGAKGSWFQDTLQENYQDALDAQKEMVSFIVELQSFAIKTNVSITDLFNKELISKEQYDLVTRLLSNISNANNYDSMISALDQINNLELPAFSKISKFIQGFKQGTDYLSIVAKGNFNESLNDLYANLDNQLSAFYVGINDIMALDPEKGKESAGKWLDSQLQALGIADKEIRKLARHYITSKLGVELVFTQADGNKTYTESDLTEEWQKTLWSAIKKVQETNPQIKVGVGIKELATEDKASIIAKLRKTVPQLQKMNDELVEAGKVKGQIYQTPEQLAQSKAAVEPLQKLADLLGLINKERGKDEQKEKLQNQINLIKEMNKEYEKLTNMPKEDAIAKVKKSYESTAKTLGLDISKMTFNRTSTINALEGLIKVFPERLKAEILKEVDNYKVEIGIEAREDELNNLKEKVETIFSKLDISKEFQDLGLSEDFAKRLFNFDFTNLDEVAERIKNMKNEFEQYGAEGVEAWNKAMEKVNDLQGKALKERVKNYHHYLLKIQRDAVRIKMDELRQLQEIEQSKYSDTEKKIMKDRVKENTKQLLDSAAWSDFKGSEMYTMMFEDLEYYGTQALENLRDKLGELRDSLKNLPANEVKEIIRQMERINEITLERNPFKELKEQRVTVKATGMSEEDAIAQAATLQANIDNLQKELDIINTVTIAREKGLSIDEETLSAYNEIVNAAKEQGIVETELANKKTVTLAKEQKSLEIAVKTVQEHKKLRNNQNAALQRTNDILGEINNAVQASMELMEALGVSGDSIAGIIVNSISSMISLTMSAIQFQIQLQEMGVAANSALGIIGWTAIAIQAIATAIAAIFKVKDKALQNQIDALAKSAEDLQEKFDELADSIDEVYSTDALAKANKEMEQLNRNLIDNLKAQKALQQERKQTDEVVEEIEALDKAIIEAEQAIVDAQKDIFSHATDGILDSAMEAARGFVDAWADAYAETGNGMKGLEENFEEMLMNMAKQQAAQQIVGLFAQQWKEDLEKYIGGDDMELTKDEAQAWAEEVRRTFPELNAALEGYLGAIMDNVGSGSLSGLEEGIAGASEETVQVVAAYLNSIRFFVAENNAVLKQLRDYQMGTEDEVNPMLAQLRIIARQTGAIHTLLDSVTRAGHPQGGSGIRVFMD